MARLLVALSVLLSAALVGAHVGTGRNATAERVACGVKAVDVYFWPHGHPAVPAYGFPAFKPAHEELYRRGSTARRGFLAFLSQGERIIAKRCRRVSDNVRTKWGGGPIKAVKTTRRIRCSFPTKVQLRASVFPGGQQLLVALGHSSKVVLYTEFRTHFSLADYDSRYCTDTAVPGVR